MKASAVCLRSLEFLLFYYLVFVFQCTEATTTQRSNYITKLPASLFTVTKPPHQDDENTLMKNQIAQQQLIAELFGGDPIHFMQLSQDKTKFPTVPVVETMTVSSVPTNSVENTFQGQGGESDTDFDWRLVKEVFGSEKSNLLISPFSIKLLLVLLYEGTRADSRTAHELQQVFKGKIPNVMEERKMFKIFLESQLKKDKEYELDIGTNIFIDLSHQVQPDYKNVIQEVYNAGIEGVKFSDTSVTANKINSWCLNATRGHIRDLVKGDSIRNAVMLMTNAIYFKGMWVTAFPEDNSKFAPFFVSNQQRVSVPFMAHTANFHYGESVALNSKLLRLPYKGSDFSMTLVLPDIESNIDSLMYKIGKAPSILAKAQKEMSFEEVFVTIPKFKFDFSTNMNEAIKALGIRDIFTNQASFPLLTKGYGELKVSNVIQKAGIIVNEKGAEAFAASAIEIVNRFSGPDELIFRANRPFIFFIEERVSGVLLFVGKVRNPLLSGK